MERQSLSDKLIYLVVNEQFDLTEKMLLDYKDNLFMLFENYHDNAFITACWCEQTKFIKLFLSYINNKKYDKIISYRDATGKTTLMLMVFLIKKNHKVISLLLKTNKAHPEYVTRYNCNALRYGVESLENHSTKSIRIFEILIETGYSHPEIKYSYFNESSIEMVNNLKASSQRYCKYAQLLNLWELIYNFLHKKLYILLIQRYITKK